MFGRSKEVRDDVRRDPRGRGSLAAPVTVCGALGLVVLVLASAVAQSVWERAREAERKSSCQNNLKELGLALAMYHSDYDSTLPSSVLYGHTKTWSKKSFKAFASSRGTLPPPRNARYMSWPMVLYAHLRNADVIWCPSDPDSGGKRVSYYYKAAVDAAWYGGPKGRGLACRKEGDFDFPADQIVFYERNGWHSASASKGLTDGVRINCTFLDSHVAFKEIQDSGYTAAQRPAEPLPKSGVGEPAWFNYSFGERNSRFSRGANWNPRVWGDRLP